MSSISRIVLLVVMSALTVTVFAESGYIFIHRRSINRFRPVDEDAYLAFDSATGQLCRTFRPGPRRKKNSAPIKPAPSCLDSEESDPDPIIRAIRGRPTEAEKKVQEEMDANTEAHAEFIRGLPSCADIR